MMQSISPSLSKSAQKGAAYSINVSIFTLADPKYGVVNEPSPPEFAENNTVPLVKPKRQLKVADASKSRQNGTIRELATDFKKLVSISKE
jgi:hypothetical protein